MTKSELIDRLIESNSLLSRKESEAIISIVFDSMRRL